MTTFLFAVDVLWVRLLTQRWVGVLYVDLRQEQQKQMEKSQW